jgi:hypothetical protein
MASTPKDVKLRRIEVDPDVADEGIVGRHPTRLRTIEKVGQSRNFAKEFDTTAP